MGSFFVPRQDGLPRAQWWAKIGIGSSIWEQGYRQRRALHTTGVDYDPAETAGSLTLISDVLHAYSFHDSPSHVCGLSGLQKSDRDSFIRTGCHWMRDLATIDMSNLHLIGQLSIKPLLRIPTHMRDETITIGHCMHTLCLLSSSTPTGDLIRKLEGFRPGACGHGSLALSLHHTQALALSPESGSKRIRLYLYILT